MGARATRLGGRICAGVLSLGLAASAALAASPRLDYVLECMGCHGAEGRGVPGKVPSLVGQLGKFLAVPGGRAYLVQVPGTAQSSLEDARVAALLNWMLTTFSPDETAGGFLPFDAEEVARHRATTLVEVEATRRRLLESMGRAE